MNSRNTFLRRGCSLATSALLTAGLSLPAVTIAQEGPLEEVIVTATKRETSLMDTAVSVSAINQVQLTNLDVKDGRDLGQLVPNLFVSLDQSQNQIELTLRGIGSTNLEQISDPTVGLHVDGLYQPRPQSAMALMFDLERLEVLRGPQGTLFGRNSTAGTVNIIPAKPVIGEFSGSTQVTVGEYNRQGLQNIINLPMGDSFAVRLAMMSDKRDSYIRQFQDFDAPDQRRNLPVVHKEDWYFNNDQRGARLSALWEVATNASWLLSYDRFDDDSAGGTRLRNCRQFDCTPGSSGSRWKPAFGRDLGTSEVYANSVDTVGRLNIEQDSIRSIFKIDVADMFQVKHSFGYIDMFRTQVGDDDGGFTNNPGFQQTLETHQSNNLSRTHELQFQSLGDSRFQWTAGYWMLEENNDFRLNVDLQFIPGAVIILWPGNKVESEAIFFDGTYALNDSWRINIGARQSDDKKASSVSAGGEVWLGFGEEAYFGDPAGTFEMENGTFAFLTDSSNVLNASELEAQGWAIAGDTDQAEPDVSSDKLTYKLGVEWDVDADSLAYATLATGYKAAPFDTILTDPSTGDIRRLKVKPEEVTNLEFGYKSTILDGRMNLSAALFFMQYEDMQRTTLEFAGTDPVTDNDIFQLVTTNASEADINGIELEFDWAITDKDRFRGWVTYIDATFGDYITTDNWYCAERQDLGERHPNPSAPSGTSPCGTDSYPLNLNGDKLAKTPEFSFQVSYEHEFVFASGATLVPWISMHFESEYYLRDFNTSIGPYSTKQDSFQTFDVNLRYTSASAEWYAELFGTNITDELVATRADTFGGAYTHNYNQPEMWGMRLGVNY